MSRLASATVVQPTGCEVAGPGGRYDVRARTDATFAVVDLDREPGTRGRVVAECASLEGAKREARRLAERGGAR